MATARWTAPARWSTGIAALLLAVSMLSAQHVAAQADATVSIQDSPAYTQLRACARRIVSEDDWLRAGLSCPAPWYNFCYCRGDLRTVATKYISSCIFTDCQYNSVDYTSVVSIYDAYCATALLASPTPTPPATAPDHAVTVTSTISPGGTAVVIVATTIVHDSAGGSASSAAPGTGTSTATTFTTAVVVGNSPSQTLYSTLTFHSTREAASSPGGGGGGLSQSDKIALGTGISIPLAALIVAVYVCLARRRGRGP